VLGPSHPTNWLIESKARAYTGPPVSSVRIPSHNSPDTLWGKSWGKGWLLGKISYRNQPIAAHLTFQVQNIE
jgi:hypothetical protein